MKAHRIAFALAAFGLCQAPSTSSADSFTDLVSEILRSQTTGMISELNDTTKTALISCVNGVLEDLPNGQKRYILQGEDYTDQESRFGKIVQQNHAEWKQKIAGACASVALAGRRESRRTFGAQNSQ
jgi:hypothetical protein